MEVDEIHSKFQRISNGSGKLGHKMDDLYPEEEDDGEKNKRAAAAATDLGGGLGRFYGWPSSRIVRVSRASGGKDRHSKVLTSKGLRDRRVRLSVNTAIQFYDLQDRLGYDQPSKAVEWLMKAAAASIAELPPITTPFPDTPRQLSDEKRSSSDHLCFDSAEVDMDPKFSQPPQAAKSSGAACSSTSETSKGSGLSLSRSESRIKARERAKERVAEKDKDSDVAGSLNPILQTTSFTELLNGGINSANHQNQNNNDGNNRNEANFLLKSQSPRHWSSTPMDYFASSLLGGRSSLGGNPFTFGVAADHHQPELHQSFSFLSDLGNQHHHHNHNNHQHHNGEYNLNFVTSSPSAENPSGGLAGFNRGTLQSNSAPPQLPHFQRYSNNNPDGSTQGFYIGTAASVENHHQFQSGYDSRLQLCYGGNSTAASNDNNGSRHSGQNEKGRN